MLSDIQILNRDLARHPNDPRNDNEAYERLLDTSFDEIMKLTVEEFLDKAETMGHKTYNKAFEVVEEVAIDNIGE